jgi:acyl-CoA thioesterase I
MSLCCERDTPLKNWGSTSSRTQKVSIRAATDLIASGANSRRCDFFLTAKYYPGAMIIFRQWIVMIAICAVPGLLRPTHAENQMTRIVAFGDSLTAGYRLPSSAAFPAQLERALRAKGYLVSIANAGVSGDTTAMGLARVNQSVSNETDAVILELGANDMLRGLEPDVARASLSAILQNLQRRRIPVLLCGVRTQPGRGAQYQNAFAVMFADLAYEYNLLFYAAFDESFVDDASLKQSDQLHPTAEGVARVVARIMPKVEALIERTHHQGQ